MGTLIKDVIEDFEMNMTGVKLVGRETMVFQTFKRSVALSIKTVRNGLEYTLNNQKFYFKLYELSNIDDEISFSIGDNIYAVLTYISDTKETILESILYKILNDYPLSSINKDVVVINSIDLTKVDLLNCGNHMVIIQPEYEGSFNRNLSQDEISLISIGMTKEWYNMQHSKVALERNNMGTKHFDKDPDRKKQYDGMIERSNYWNLEFLRYRQEFSTFGY